MTWATASLRIEPLESGHDRQAFDCGVASLNRYLREQPAQDMRRATDTGGEFSPPRSLERTYLTPSRQVAKHAKHAKHAKKSAILRCPQSLRERLRFRYRLEDPWRHGALA
ncbi:hypothetical protein [uncultured Lamprocystis sp.]|uniref:hypothetical protein n=1 Tax=uncultured Lamprocystis sp. TaxID=543132 RepID=UPI0025D6CD20|nr:hypothetical protein [uncultured Lamprocystis sp.]